MLRLLACLVLLVLGGFGPALAAFDSADLPTGGPLSISRITPEGEDVPPGKQIVIEFNRPVVAVGRMERSHDEVPVSITPALNCQWRWITTRTLACNLDDKDRMQPSTGYKMVVQPGLKTIDGVTIEAAHEHEFVTRRAEVRDSGLRYWNSPVRPVYRVYWDQAVGQDSVQKHVFFATTDGKRFEIKASADKRKRFLPKWLRMPGEKLAAETNEAEQTSDDEAQTIHGQDFRRVWIIEPASDLPEGADVSLQVEPGLKPAAGDKESVEKRDIENFATFPAFAFAGIACTSNTYDENGQYRDVTIAPGNGQSADEYCNPLKPVSLQFTAPVFRGEVRYSLSSTPEMGQKLSGEDSPWGTVPEGDDRRVVSSQVAGRMYNVWLPGGLKAAQAYDLTLHGGPGNIFARLWAWLTHKPMENAPLRDAFGRSLPGTVHMVLNTAHRLPNYILEYSAAVLEKNIDSEVPIYVNNLQQMDWSINRLTADGATHVDRTVQVPAARDVQFLMPLGIRGMLDGKTGALWGSFATTPEMPGNHRRDELFAEVTPFQVHVKLGHFNTLAWVTDMATGQPVADAVVNIYTDRLKNMAGPRPDKVPVKTDADGVAILPGTEQIDPDLKQSRVWDTDEQRFFVRVRKNDDVAVLPIWGQFEIDSYRSTGTSFYPRNEKKFGHMVTWGTSAQGIYHPGDTIQYKFYVRNNSNKELVPAPRSGYWLEVVDPTGKVVYTAKDISLNEYGSASGEFAVSKKAAVGWYNFRLKANFRNPPKDDESQNCGNTAHADSGDEDEAEGEEAENACGTPAEFTWTPLRVMVSDFTPVPFQVRNHLNGDLFHPGETVTVETEAKLHSGGPYTQAQARVTAELTPTPFTSKNPAAAGFIFSSHMESTEAQQLYEGKGQVDEKGGYKTDFAIADKKVFHGRLMVESAVQDDRGKYVAHESYADYVGVDRLVGLRLPQWFYKTGDDIAADFVVVDDRGNPVKGVPVSMVLRRKDRNGARVKSSGSAYVTDSEENLVTEAECKSVSGELAASCHMKTAHAGEYTLKATVQDTHGNAQTTETALWLTGGDYVMWDDGSDAYLDIIADREAYHVGDTAHYMVKNPYPGAKALVTVERFGVIDRFVITLKDSASVIDLPIKPEYLPGFYLSVVVMSPRVEKPVEPGQVDLGKPTFRMGYLKIQVKDTYKEIAVTAGSDRETYRPGDKVRVKINAVARHGKNEPVEVAVAVLDEAVFDLIAQGKSYYDPYGGFYNLESLDLRNYSLLTRLIGRQKFEKKGANPGGDGGSSLSMRSVFKYVSYWNPSLKTDAAGNAEIEFTVPDNLTGWHILAMASTATDRFGLGEANFKVNRPTEVRPEMPNQVAEGDSFDARFSVMNRTQQPRTLTVKIKAEGDIDTAAKPDHLEQSLNLKPYERALVALPVKAKGLPEDRSVEEGKITFTVEAGDASDRDGMVHSLPVRKLRSLDVAANYGTTLENAVSEAVAIPENIHTDVGNLTVSVSPTVLGNLEGAFRYIRDYPYTCWEQQLTRGVMASQFKDLRNYLAAKMEWPGYEKLPDQMIALASEHQAPGGGMAYFIATDDHADPYLSAYTALGFNWLRHSGYQIPPDVEKKLHAYLQDMLRRDVAPSYYTASMTSSVRAVALAALAETREVEIADIRRYAPFARQMDLFGMAHFTRAAMLVPGGQGIAVDTAKMIMAHANETGGKFSFSEEHDDSYSRILSTPLRDNCAILDAMVSLGETAYGRDVVSDVPYKLVRTITQTRGGRDHWENTQENMFCLNALADYARVYEHDVPSMKVTAAFNQKAIGETTFRQFRDPLVKFVRPLGQGDAGLKANMDLTREGTGRVYYATHLSYAPLTGQESDTNAGMEIHREYSMQRDGKWVILAKPYAVVQGDVIRVDLYLSLPSAREFVVVDDPVPGAFEPINTDLANASKTDAAKGAFHAAGGSMWFKYNDWNEYDFSFWSFNHKELLHSAARFYADYLPAGNYHLSYMVQVIGAGDYAVMPALASEMYDPDIYGKTVFEQVSVKANQIQPLP